MNMNYDLLAALHAECFPNKPWPAEEFSKLQKSGAEIILSDNSFIVWRTVLDESEIVSIGVHPDMRCAGIASALLGMMCKSLKSQGVRMVFLEVAAGNIPAIKLYERNGFIKIGARPKYYDGIDAVTMKKDL